MRTMPRHPCELFVVPDDADERSLSLASTATTATDAETGHETDATELSDDGSELSCGASTSLSPSVCEDEVAHGRRYHGYRRGRYPLPNDGQEQQRQETSHAMMLEITGGHLFYADIGDRPQKIIDIGTGTGSWAIDVADQCPSASVVGTDLSAMQPRWVPVNARMFVDDCEQPDWLHGSSYDLVFFRGMAGVLQDLDAVLARAYPRIRDGGWVEFHEVVPQVLCDDGTMAADDALRVLYDAAARGMRAFGCDPLRAARLEPTLHRAGFTNIRCVTRRIPIAGWPRDRQLRTLGLLMKAVVLDSLDALAAKPLAALGLEPQARRELQRRARASLEDGRVHRYVDCCFCYGQKRDDTGGPWC